jgi:hypothetical protein
MAWLCCRHPGDNPFYSNIDSMPDIRPRRKSIPLVSELVSAITAITCHLAVLPSSQKKYFIDVTRCIRLIVFMTNFLLAVSYLKQPSTYFFGLKSIYENIKSSP